MLTDFPLPEGSFFGFSKGGASLSGREGGGGEWGTESFFDVIRLGEKGKSFFRDQVLPHERGGVSNWGEKDGGSFKSR